MRCFTLDSSIGAGHFSVFIPKANGTVATKVEFGIQGAADVLGVIVEHWDGNDGTV
jgi:hypothetical protein